MQSMWKIFLNQFLILYIIGVQKIPTLRPLNFARVDQPLQLYVGKMFKLRSDDHKFKFRLEYFIL